MVSLHLGGQHFEGHCMLLPSSIALGGTSAKFPKNGNLYIFPKTPPPRKAETVFQCMAAAWAQANPAARAKLERAQRSYNETSRGM